MKTKELHIIKAFLVLAITASLCGCGKDKVKNNSIGFNSEMTKGYISEVQDIIDDGRGLSIFGLRVTQNGDSILQFSNRALTYDSGSATLWSYSGNLEYWITDNTYYFAAIFPYSSTGYTYSILGQNVSFDYESVLPANSENQNDVMWAVHKRQYSDEGDHSPVPLNLKHACASLTFNVRNVSTTTVSISGIYLDGLYNNGRCAIDTLIRWTTTGDIVSDNTIYPGRTSGLSNLPVGTSTYYSMFSDTILVVPQQVRNRPVALHAEVTYSGSIDPKAINAYLRNSASVEKWEANKHYIYTLSITDNSIVFEVEVLNWIDNEIELE